MSLNTGIEWTEATWNPTRGCKKTSPGCNNCYAAFQANRFKGAGKPYEGLAEHGPNGPDWTGKLRLVEEYLELPLHWRNPHMVFVNSMSDLFHGDVPDEYIGRVFDVMCRASLHTFQILTKRAERLAALAGRLPWPSNVWMGVSVESADYLGRIDCLRSVPAAVRFLSIEPLLGPLSGLDLSEIDWVIVGGESGPRARPMKEAWVLDILEQCTLAGVSFFFKQWGGRNKKKAGRTLLGRTWDEMPPSIHRRPARPEKEQSCR
jgi:protein gp37